MKYIKVWTDFTKSIEPLKDAERGRLFTAMLIYAEQNTEPELAGNERFIWPTVKAEIDRQIDAYDHKCEVNRINGASRTQSHPVAASGGQSHPVAAREDKDKDKDKDKERASFIPPTLEEVRAYCKERHNTVNPRRFIAWYNACGWQRKGQPITDWKALLQTWEDDKAYQNGEPKRSKYEGLENLSAAEDEDFRRRYADVLVNGVPLGAK